MKLYLDDRRSAPIDFELVDCYNACITKLAQNKGKIEELSLDHDLGELRNGYDVCKWIVENKWWDGLKKVTIHSANPVGVKNMTQLLDRYLPKEIEIWYRVNNDFVKLYRY